MCLSRAAAEAGLPDSQHFWGSSTFQQTQNLSEGTTHHHLSFGSHFTLYPTAPTSQGIPPD